MKHLIIAASLMTTICASTSLANGTDPSYPEFKGVSHLEEAAPEAVALLHWMSSQTGILPTYRVVQGRFTSNNVLAFATIREKRRYIVLNTQRLRFLNGRTDWCSAFVLAHELGHHLSSHVFADDLPGIEQEAEAHRYGGYILAKMGATQKQAQSCFFGNWPATKTHPGSVESRRHVAKGWLLANSHKK